MKKQLHIHLLLIIGIITLFFQSCENNYDSNYETFSVKVQLNYPDQFQPTQNVPVSLLNLTNNVTYTHKTDSQGIVQFEIPSGIYEIFVSETRTIAAISYIFSGNNRLGLNDFGKKSETVTIELSVSQSASIIIKELYNGGCPKDDGSGTFRQGQYIILYNNSEASVSLDNFGLSHY